MPRSFTISDYLALRSFEAIFGPQFDISACGTKICFSCQRGRDDAPFLCSPFMGSVERGEVFLWCETTNEVVPIPTPRGAGIFSPVWSRDGSLIAACLVDQAGAYPVIISEETGELKKLTDRSLGLRPTYRPVEWLSATEIGCDLLEEEQAPFVLKLETKAAETLIGEWRAAHAGSRATATLFSAGDTEPEPDFGTLSVVDIRDGRVASWSDPQSRPDAVQRFLERPSWPYPAHLERSPKGDAKSRLLVFEQAEQGVRLLADHDDDGTRIIWERPGRMDRVLPFFVNRHLAEVIPGPSRFLSFSTPGNKNLAAKLVLPPKGIGRPPYPCVVWVYPGALAEKEIVETDSINSHYAFNTQLLAAKGYAVLKPSIPLPDETEAGAITRATAVAVTGAIEAAVETGVICREELHVAGHSFGGWAAMSLLTTTPLFRTGIALAGCYNLTSTHGQVDARSRMDPVLRSFSEGVEKFFRLSGKPAEQLDHYVAESPLFAAERVDAPVLLVHGDQDYIGVEQAEEMFSALRSYGKDASFLRFSGEGHLISSPHNITTMYETIFEWLGKHR